MFNAIVILILFYIAFTVLKGSTKPKRVKTAKRNEPQTPSKKSNIQKLSSVDVSVPFADKQTYPYAAAPPTDKPTKVEHKKSTHLTTKNERNFHEALRVALPDEYVIHCQVSLMALIQPVNFKDNSKTWAKRMDFVVTDKDTKVVCVIELDDRTHEWESRKKRDKYVNEVLDGHHQLIRFSSQPVYKPREILDKLIQTRSIGEN